MTRPDNMGADGSGWMPIETAPNDGTVFLAVNHDGEIWPTKLIDGRFAYRTNGRCEPRRFTYVHVHGECLLREDEQYAKDNEEWQSRWTYWSRLYEFEPHHWMPLPTPPAGEVK